MPLLIFVSCFAILIYYKQINQLYDLKWLAILGLFGLSLMLRLKIIPDNRSQLLIVSSSMPILITGVVTFFVSLFIYLMSRSRKLNFAGKFILILLPVYLLFGFCQQILFQFIFAGTIYYLTQNLCFSIITTSLFYFSFHIRRKNQIKLFFTFGLNIIWAFIYLKYGNILWPTISHGILGVVYYSKLFEGDVLTPKLKFLQILVKSGFK